MRKTETYTETVTVTRTRTVTRTVEYDDGPGYRLGNCEYRSNGLAGSAGSAVGRAA